jgi:hypothetical protein
MRRPVFWILFVIGHLIGPVVFAHEAPKGIASVTLGASISDLQDKVDLGSAVPLGGANYLMRAPLNPVNGFESGYVVYGNCKEKGRIVRVKLKYENDEESFYNEVLSALRKRYGKPTEWKGNPFGTLKIWKWSLKDAGHHPINIQLQRYEGDDDAFTPGNSIKLTNSKYLDEEKVCYESKKTSLKGERHDRTPTEKVDFEIYLPH